VWTSACFTCRGVTVRVWWRRVRYSRPERSSDQSALVGTQARLVWRLVTGAVHVAERHSAICHRHCRHTRLQVPIHGPSADTLHSTGSPAESRSQLQLLLTRYMSSIRFATFVISMLIDYNRYHIVLPYHIINQGVTGLWIKTCYSLPTAVATLDKLREHTDTRPVFTGSVENAVNHAGWRAGLKKHCRAMPFANTVTRTSTRVLFTLRVLTARVHG